MCDRHFPTRRWFRRSTPAKSSPHQPKTRLPFVQGSVSGNKLVPACGPAWGASLIVRAEAAGKRVESSGATMNESSAHLVTFPENGMECLAGAAVACIDAVASLMQDTHRQRCPGRRVRSAFRHRSAMDAQRIAATPVCRNPGEVSFAGWLPCLVEHDTFGCRILPDHVVCGMFCIGVQRAG